MDELSECCFWSYLYSRIDLSNWRLCEGFLESFYEKLLEKTYVIMINIGTNKVLYNLKIKIWLKFSMCGLKLENTATP